MNIRDYIEKVDITLEDQTIELRELEDVVDEVLNELGALHGHVQLIGSDDSKTYTYSRGVSLL